MKRPRWPWAFGSGAAVGGLFTRLFALIWLGAWVSLAVQVRVLIGGRGLLPVAALMQAARNAPGVTVFDLPTIFWRFHSDGLLVAGTMVGVSLAVAALLGWRSRICFAISTVLYLSYATVGRDFLSFQWDNLLLECGLLASFLPDDAPAPLVHLLFRLVLFKLYFESGLAKWQSPISDWQDGSAMTSYYETAPLPTWVAFAAHHLPVWWHHLESRLTLLLELALPFLIFGPRRARLTAAVAFGFFQVLNAATANYGFFCYLAAILNVFLLDDVDVQRAAARAAPFVPAAVRRLVARLRAPIAGPAPASPAAAPSLPRLGPWPGRVAVAIWIAVSLVDGLVELTEPGRVLTLAMPVFELSQRFRLVNTYHLFASITRERIEPEFQVLAAGDPEKAADDAWTPLFMWHKPGDPGRAPDFVAPHQPRVDFQLWFYGLSFQRREPSYVTALVERLCEDPAAVQPLFRAPLPPHPAAVRIVFWQYQFTSPAERRATGAWWRRARAASSRAVPCLDAAP